MFSVHIQSGPIALDAPTDPDRDDCGAEVRFIGKVRNDPQHAPVGHLMLEHFPGVTESEIERIIHQARQRWPLQKVRVVHRVGRIAVGEVIVLVETASAHRKDAYAANAFVMDYLKTEAPFWKQECFTDGTEAWVEARASDQKAASRWQNAATLQRAEGQGPRIGALILAGGEGRRMGYLNKGLQRLQGRPLVEHVADTLRPHVHYLAVSANRDLADYEAMGFPVFPDDPRFQVGGPLAGVLAALPRFPFDLDAFLVVPCDCPLLPADLVPRLASALFAPGGPPAVVAASDGLHPSIFMCRPAVLVSLIPHLQDSPKHRIRDWLEAAGCEVVSFEDARAFSNINDLQALQALES